MKPDPEKVLGGEIPSPLKPPSGCRSAPDARRRRRVRAGGARGARDRANHYVACHFPLDEGEQLDFATVGPGALIGYEDSDKDELDR